MVDLFGDDEEGIIRDALRLPCTAEEVRDMDLLREARDAMLDLKGGTGTDKGWGELDAGYTRKEVLIAGLLLLLDEAKAPPATGGWVKPAPRTMFQRLAAAIQDRDGGQLL